MAQEVRYTSFERADIFNRKLLFVEPAVHLERADSGNNDHRVGRKSRHAALYIEELFGTEICAESRFGDGVVAHLERHLSRHDGVAAVRYVRERSAVDECGRALKGLDKVGLQGVFQKRGHRAGRLELAAGHGLVVVGVADDHAREPRFEVGYRA